MKAPLEVLVTGAEMHQLRSRERLNAHILDKLTKAGVPAALNASGNVYALHGILTAANHPQFPMAITYTWKPITSIL